MDAGFGIRYLYHKSRVHGRNSVLAEAAYVSKQRKKVVTRDISRPFQSLIEKDGIFLDTDSPQMKIKTA